MNKERIFQWIEEMCSLPHRRTGTKEGRLSAEYIAQQFNEIGLEDVSIDEVPALCFAPEYNELNINGTDYPCFIINGTFQKEAFGEFCTGKDYEELELVYLNEGREADFEGKDITGKIVMCDCPWFDMDESKYANDWCSQEAVIYDPDSDKRKPLRKTDSYSPNAWPYNYIMAQQKGAAGFIGVLTDYFEDGIEWSEDYSEIGQAYGCERFEIPGLWIGITAANKIKEQYKVGETKATLKVKVRYFEGFARDVSAVLPGMSDEIIIVHSHHDAVFTGAVQDASGMAEVLAIAEHYASIPMEERPKTLVFAGLDGHYTDYAGHIAFVEKMKNSGEKICADVVIEHIGKEVGLDENNYPVISEEPEIRLLYVTNEKELVERVTQSIKDNLVKRTVIMPVNPYRKPESGFYEFQQDEVISDAYYSHLAGFRIVSILSPPLYLFHPMDTPEMVPKDELVKVGRAFVNIIDYLLVI